MNIANRYIKSMKTVIYKTSARKEMRKIPAKMRERIAQALQHYAETGEGDIKALTGRDDSRLRVGNYRAVFVEDADTITIRVVRHRKDVYR